MRTSMASLAGRRLAELLQEQQEPFLLDVYLLENGYSGRILCSEASATCWPSGNSCRRLQRLASQGFRRRGEGIIESLVGVFVRRSLPRASNWGREALEDGGSLSSMGRKNRYTGKDGGELGKIKVDAGRAHGWECTEAKQLSPVSVLELQSDDGSPAHDHTKEEEPSTSGLYVSVGVVEVLEELQGSASSKYMRTKEESHGRRQPLFACVKEGGVEEERSLQSEQRDQHLHESLGSHRTGKARRRQGSTWRRRAGDAITASDLTESGVLEYSKKWNHFNPHVTEIGVEVGDAILDELVEDIVSHI